MEYMTPEYVWAARMAAPRALLRFVGQEVNVFGPRSCEEHENCLGTGYLLAIEDGFLLLSEEPQGRPDIAIALPEVATLEIIKEKPELSTLEGGKVFHLKRTEPSEEPKKDGDR